MQVSITAKNGFEVIAGSDHSQPAMVLEPGQSVGSPEHQHKHSDQWLFVLAGAGRASVGGEPVNLSAGTLLLLEAGETHEIFNNGERPFETRNVYAPPEY